MISFFLFINKVLPSSAEMKLFNTFSYFSSDSSFALMLKYLQIYLNGCFLALSQTVREQS